MAKHWLDPWSICANVKGAETGVGRGRIGHQVKPEAAEVLVALVRAMDLVWLAKAA